MSLAHSTEGLHRSRDARVLAGVAGGLATWLRVPVGPVRVALVALALLDGIGAVMYAVLALALPSAPPGAGHDTDPPTTPLATPPRGVAPQPPPPGTEPERERRARLAIGAGIVLVGAWLLARQLGLVPDLRWSAAAAAALVLTGAVLLASRRAAP